jgi:hypothetical protein
MHASRTLLYLMVVPFSKDTILFTGSRFVTVMLYFCLSFGSRAATFVHIPPVPPSCGNRNTAFGPQPLSVLFLKCSKYIHTYMHALVKNICQVYVC